MNGSLGRDKVWNDQIWSEIDKAVREEVGRVRVAQKVFPSTVVNSVLPVSTTRAVPFGPGAGPPVPPAPGGDVFQPLFEISSEFVLTQAQVGGDENVHLAPSRAKLAASTVASAEDAILFLGQGGIPAGVNVTNQPPAGAGIPPQFTAIPPGFVAEAVNYPPFASVVGAAPRAANPVLGNILRGIARGMAYLNARAQPGPYALFLPPTLYALTFAPVQPGLLKTPGDEINQVVTGGFYMVSSLPFGPPTPPPDRGILVSLGGEPAKIIIGTDATTAFTFTDALGNYHFRVFERIQMVVQDGRAFQLLTFP
jgi:Encapsulating protein for peroxidase